MAKNSRATGEQLAEQIRHNKQIEEQNAVALKSRSGYLSQLASKVPVFGQALKHALEKLRSGFRLVPRGRGFYLNLMGEGFHLDPRGKDLY